jgi:hypothetical protein
MTISDKSRKRLWAKSGNRCAISKIELIFDPAGETDESIIGEECHICAKHQGGPRYDASLSAAEAEEYNNLILLSRNYHKIIDDNPSYYTPLRLQNIKKSHEEWVRKTLDFEIRNIKSTKFPESKISFLTRILTGSQLLNVISGCFGYDFDNDELHNETEVDLVRAFLQNAQDWGDLMSDMESGERVRTKFALSEQLQELEDNGFWIFGGVASRKVRLGEEIANWRISVLRVLRADNSDIVKVGFDSSDMKSSEQPLAPDEKPNE